MYSMTLYIDERRDILYNERVVEHGSAHLPSLVVDTLATRIA